MESGSRLSTTQILQRWVARILPNAQALSLALVLLVGFLLTVSLAEMLMPVFAAGVIAYLLEGIVALGQRNRMPRIASVLVVFTVFMAFVTFLLVALLPLLTRQLQQLFEQLPKMMSRAQDEIMQLPDLYPEYITEAQVHSMVDVIQKGLLAYVQDLISLSASSFVGVITVVVYLILVPMLVFFFLKDKTMLMTWFRQYLPRDSHLSLTVWREVDVQIGNYVRGKFVEILILWLASYVTFTVMGLNYSLLLGLVIGLSVVIPYIGATVVTFPVIVVAYFQWGLNDDFFYIMIAYGILQALDGIVLVPLLFSEAVNLHPIAIIIGILFFGGLWGFWGVFFAIPLATLVKAVLSAWPRGHEASISDCDI